jgi:LPXTG-motif cell wall-anchored protein
VAYTTVFDLAETGFKSWWFPAVGLIFIAIGILVILGRYKHSGGKRFPLFFLGFAIIWTSVSGAWTYSEYLALRSAKDGSAQVVEGRISDFVPMPKSGHAMERFCVSGKCFEYSDFVITSGFNNTSSHGGPVREGLLARVTYVGDDIVKLEIAQ